MVTKQEVIGLRKIFDQLKKDARIIVDDLSIGIKSFGVIGAIGIILGVWSIGEGVLALFFHDIPSIFFWPYVVLGSALVISGVWIVRRFLHLKRRYSWVFKAKKSLKNKKVLPTTQGRK